MPDTLYDAFDDYDRFVDWNRRLAHELPFIQGQLEAVGAQRVLDAACGTGAHAIALARRGYDITGVDISAGMIARARANVANARGDRVRFVVGGFGHLATEAGTGYDALICLGNSLPHVLTERDLDATLRDFAAALRPGGLLLVQNRNMDAVLAAQSRWMPLRAHREGGQEWLFVRFYDFNADGTLTFNVVRLYHNGNEPWTQHVNATTLRPWLREELERATKAAGFECLARYGDLSGTAYTPTSSNLVLVARRTDWQYRVSASSQ